MTNNSMRQYLLVDTSKTMSGIEVPRKIYWFDGRCFEVDSVQFIKPVPKSMDGATCFTVIIAGRKANIYKDYRGWYVYPKEKLTDEDLAAMYKNRVLKTLTSQ